MTAFMSEDPETGHHEAIGEAVECPHRKARKGEERGDLDKFRSKECICVVGGLVDRSDEEEIPDANGGRVSFG